MKKKLTFLLICPLRHKGGGGLSGHVRLYFFGRWKNPTSLGGKSALLLPPFWIRPCPLLNTQGFPAFLHLRCIQSRTHLVGPCHSARKEYYVIGCVTSRRVYMLYKYSFRKNGKSNDTLTDKTDKTNKIIYWIIVLHR